MTPSRDPNALIAAFFDQPQPELPERAIDSVREAIHHARHRARPWSRYVALVAAVGLIVVGLELGMGPAGHLFPSVPGTPAPTPTLLPTAAPTSHPTDDSTFTSAAYGYTIALGAGWHVRPAIVPWTGRTQPAFGGSDVDSFTGPGQLSVAGFASPMTGDLQALVEDRITANARDHADTCPPDALQVNQPVHIAGVAGTLLGWNCGALIYQAMTMDHGVAYLFSFRDLGIKAASDADDLAIFETLLDSVELPSPTSTP